MASTFIRFILRPIWCANVPCVNQIEKRADRLMLESVVHRAAYGDLPYCSSVCSACACRLRMYMQTCTGDAVYAPDGFGKREARETAHARAHSAFYLSRSQCFLLLLRQSRHQGHGPVRNERAYQKRLSVSVCCCQLRPAMLNKQESDDKYEGSVGSHQSINTLQTLQAF